MKNDPTTNCNETHVLPSRQGESVLTGVISFASAGVGKIIPSQLRAQIFEIDLQPDAAVDLQLLEGSNPVSGLWTFAANQFFAWTGKFINDIVQLSASGACNVKFEVRFRTY